MKKLTRLAIGAASVLFIFALIINPVSAQNVQTGGGKPIPDKIVKIAEKSCMKCHAEPGNKMALTHVNLSKWDSYSPEKQAAKAKAMCKMVTKGKMPPKNFRKEHPNDVPTKDQITAICDWSHSIQPAGK